MRRLVVLVVLLVAGCTAMPSPPAAATPVETGTPLTRGRALVDARCSSCHAVGAEGDSPVSPAPPLRMLGQRYPVADLQEAFAEGISTGHPQMPQIQLEAGQVRDLIAYLESLQSPARKP